MSALLEAETVPSEPQWWEDHRNLALVAAFMFRQGHTEDQVVYMIEKPWKHNDDYNLAVAERDLPGDLG